MSGALRFCVDNPLVIGLLVILYARYYLSANDPMGRFYAYLLLFQGSMLGVVLSENLIQLVIFWELTSISSFLLISYWRYRDDARDPECGAGQFWFAAQRGVLHHGYFGAGL